jgi:hypothetical protein
VPSVVFSIIRANAAQAGRSPSPALLLKNWADGSIKSSAPLARWAFGRVSGELNETLTAYEGYYRRLHGEAIEP